MTGFGSSQPINVIVVGAGIAGLSAAIGLRRAGHHVELFEQSRFTNEIGAALNICPNASRLLSRWGFDSISAEAVTVQTVIKLNFEVNIPDSVTR